jgi:hypothetical protein
MLTVLIAVGAGSLLGGIAAILLVIRCRRSRAKSVSPMPADERGVATHGIELEEDFDIVKADRPVRQADAAVRLARDREAEATIDVVKKDKPVAPAILASIASALASSSSASSSSAASVAPSPPPSPISAACNASAGCTFPLASTGKSSCCVSRGDVLIVLNSPSSRPTRSTSNV